MLHAMRGRRGAAPAYPWTMFRMPRPLAAGRLAHRPGGAAPRDASIVGPRLQIRTNHRRPARRLDGRRGSGGDRRRRSRYDCPYSHYAAPPMAPWLSPSRTSCQAVRAKDATPNGPVACHGPPRSSPNRPFRYRARRQRARGLSLYFAAASRRPVDLPGRRCQYHWCHTP